MKAALSLLWCPARDVWLSSGSKVLGWAKVLDVALGRAGEDEAASIPLCVSEWCPGTNGLIYKYTAMPCAQGAKLSFQALPDQEEGARTGPGETGAGSHILMGPSPGVQQGAGTVSPYRPCTELSAQTPFPAHQEGEARSPRSISHSQTSPSTCPRGHHAPLQHLPADMGAATSQTLGTGELKAPMEQQQNPNCDHPS